MSCKNGTGCNCGEQVKVTTSEGASYKYVSPEGTVVPAHKYSDMIVVAYGVTAYPPWREEEIPQTHPWHVETDTDIKIPDLTVPSTNSCKDCKTVKVLRDLVEMLLKRIDILEAKLEGKKKVSKCK